MICYKKKEKKKRKKRKEKRKQQCEKHMLAQKRRIESDTDKRGEN